LLVGSIELIVEVTGVWIKVVQVSGPKLSLEFILFTLWVFLRLTLFLPANKADSLAAIRPVLAAWQAESGCPGLLGLAASKSLVRAMIISPVSKEGFSCP
jgi:hypothetical protein